MTTMTLTYTRFDMSVDFYSNPLFNVYFFTNYGRNKKLQVSSVINGFTKTVTITGTDAALAAFASDPTVLAEKELRDAYNDANLITKSVTNA